MFCNCAIFVILNKRKQQQLSFSAYHSIKLVAQLHQDNVIPTAPCSAMRFLWVSSTLESTTNTKRAQNNHAMSPVFYFIFLKQFNTQ